MRHLRAVTYARVSTEKRTQQTSVARQLDELKWTARRRHWDPVWQYSDRLSGGKDDRPGLRAALDLINRGKAQVLVVHDLDRLGRNVRELLANLDAIHAAGGQLFILSLNIDTSTIEGRLTFTISGALAEFQRRDIVRKVIAGIEYARKKGVRLGRPPAMGAAALARAVELRRKRPRPSWNVIRRTLTAEKLGTYKTPTIAGAVVRAVDRTKRGHQKTPPKRHAKTSRKLGVAAAAARRSRIT